MDKVGVMNKIIKGLNIEKGIQSNDYKHEKIEDIFSAINAIVDAVNELNQKLQNNK